MFPDFCYITARLKIDADKSLLILLAGQISFFN